MRQNFFRMCKVIVILLSRFILSDIHFTVHPTRYAKMAVKASTAPVVQGGFVGVGGEDGQPIFVNRVEYPNTLQTPADPKISESKSGGPTPIGKRQLDQEEFNRRLKAKRAIFSGKRSLSLASFR